MIGFTIQKQNKQFPQTLLFPVLVIGVTAMSTLTLVSIATAKGEPEVSSKKTSHHIETNTEVAQLLKKADELAARRDFSAALETINAPGKLDRHSIEFLARKGWYEFHTAKYPESIETYTELLKYMPDSPEVLHMRAKACAFGRRDTDRAIQDLFSSLEHGAKRDTPSIKADKYVLLARLHGKKGKWGKFVFYNNLALETDKDCVIAYHQRFTFFYHNKNYARALKDLTEYLKRKADARAYSIRGDCYRNLQRNDLARADLEKAVSLGGGDFAPYLFRGLLYYHLADNKKAIEDFSQAIKLNPGGYEAYYWRGMAYDELGEERLSREDKNQARKLVKGKGERVLNFTVPGLDDGR